MSTYQVTFGQSFVKPMTLTVDDSFFTESNGYDVLYRDQILRMSPGDRINIAEHDQYVTCIRNDLDKIKQADIDCETLITSIKELTRCSDRMVALAAIDLKSELYGIHEKIKQMVAVKCQ